MTSSVLHGDRTVRCADELGDLARLVAGDPLAGRLADGDEPAAPDTPHLASARGSGAMRSRYPAATTPPGATASPTRRDEMFIFLE